MLLVLLFGKVYFLNNSYNSVHNWNDKLINSSQWNFYILIFCKKKLTLNIFHNMGKHSERKKLWELK